MSSFLTPENRRAFARTLNRIARRDGLLPLPATQRAAIKPAAIVLKNTLPALAAAAVDYVSRTENKRTPTPGTSETVQCYQRPNDNDSRRYFLSKMSGKTHQPSRPRTARGRQHQPTGTRLAIAKRAPSAVKSLSNRGGNTGRLGLGSGGNRSYGNKRVQFIEEDEYIGEVYPTAGYTTTTYPVNIGQTGVFPFGAQIAKLYERYEFVKLEFYYKREVSEYATGGQNGKVILSFDYDSTDAAPINKQQVEDTVPHSDDMPNCPKISLRLDPKEMHAMGIGRYVLTGAQPAGTDLKTYNVGQLFVTTQGCNASTTIPCGELRVKYIVKLYIPQLSISQSLVVPGNAVIFTTTDVPIGSAALYNNFIAANVLSSANPIQNTINNTGVTLNFATGAFSFPAPGVNWFIEFVVMATSVTANVSGLTIYIGSSATTSSHYTIGNAGSGSVGMPAGITSYTASGSTVWNTSVGTGQGATMYLGTNMTYSGSYGVAHVMLRITQLGAAAF